MRERRRRRRDRDVELRILLWNIYIGNHPTAVRAALILLAGLFRPHLIALQEARRFTGTIPGYRRHAADDSPREDATQNITLVRADRRNVTSWPMYVPGKGWTYDGNPKPPRTFHAVTVPHAGLLWHVLNVHRCVGGPTGNSPAEWRHEDAVIAGWAETIPADDPAAAVGDWNGAPTNRRPLAVGDLADRIDAKALTAGGIDYALIRGCGGTIRALARSFGSDHAPRFITLTARRTPRRSTP